MRALKRELHLKTLLGDEVYQEHGTDCDVVSLWYDRLAANDSVLSAHLVYTFKDNGKVHAINKLK